jgi:hypothetical protein
MPGILTDRTAATSVIAAPSTLLWRLPFPHQFVGWFSGLNWHRFDRQHQHSICDQQVADRRRLIGIA